MQIREPKHSMIARMHPLLARKITKLGCWSGRRLWERPPRFVRDTGAPLATMLTAAVEGLR